MSQKFRVQIMLNRFTEKYVVRRGKLVLIGYRGKKTIWQLALKNCF